MATSSENDKDPFAELLAKKRRMDAAKGNAKDDPFAELLAKKRQMDADKAAADSSQPAQEQEAPKKSFFDKALETVSDMGIGALDEATYGYAADIAPYVLPLNDTKKVKQELSDRLKVADERSPVASTIGKIGGFAMSPATMLLGGALGAESKLASLLKDTGALAKSPALRALAKTLGFALPAAEGSVMVAAHEGEHTPIEIAAGGAMNAGFNKLPNVVKGGIIGATMGDLASRSYLPNAGILPALAGAAGGALTGKGGSMLLNAINAKRDPAKLKEPLEYLEAQYEELGRNIPSEMRGPNKVYKVPNWELQSKKVRDIKGEIEDLRIKDLELSDVPQKSRDAYSKTSQYLGDIKHDSLREVLGDPDRLEKFLTALRAMNQAAGTEEDSMITLNRIIQQKKLLSDKAEYDPLDDSVSDIIIGKIRQTPIRHIKAFNNVFSESRRLKDLNPDSIPNDVLEMYGKTLQAEQDVRTGRLNKWLRDADKAGIDTPDYARLFDPEHPSKMLTDAQAKKMADEGRIVVMSPKQLQKRNKLEENTKDKFKDELYELSELVQRQKSSSSDKQTPEEMLNLLLGDRNRNMEAAGNLLESNKPTEDQKQLSGLLQRLYDMQEGRRQLSIDRNKPSMVPYFIKDALDRISPLRASEAGKVIDLLPINKLEKMDKNLRYHARNYGKGEMIEKLPQELRPQVFRLQELSQRQDPIGTFARTMLQQVEAGNIDNFVKGMYMANQNSSLRQFLQ